MKQGKGTFRISRVQSDIESDYISVEMRSQSTGDVILKARMSLMAFADAITGRGAECDYVLRPFAVSESEDQKLIPLGKLTKRRVNIQVAQYEGGEYIAKIKAVCALTGAGLKESKDWVDEKWGR